MKKRWLGVGLLAGIVFAINAIARLVVRLAPVEDEGTQDLVSMYAYVAIGLALAALAIVWGRLRPPGEVVADLAGAAVLGGLLALLVGPYLSETTAAQQGLDVFIDQGWRFAAFAGGGAAAGLLLLIMLGRDYTSRSLARYAEERLAKPRRAVRR